ncbi:MAG TPA: hypothetical protein VMT46_13400 [Anaerolineaceae bacterium]|nr:hypothetical protein [Anaerolineaceae bacterium]
MDSIVVSMTNQLYLVIAPEPAAPRLLELTARLALRGPSLLLDCGNCAQPYTLARELRRLTPDPVRALAHLHVARAFTCYQVATLLEEAAMAGFTDQAVLVFDLLATFYDENVTCAESRRLLARSLGCIQVLARRAPVVVSARPPHAAFPERKSFLEDLRALASLVWEEPVPSDEMPKQLPLFLDGEA